MRWPKHLLIWAPRFDPSSEWCDPSSFTCFAGNCLDYAADRPPDRHAIPATLRLNSANTPSEIRQSLRRNGFRRVPTYALHSPLWRWSCRGEGHLIAVAFGPDTVPNRVPPTDYHCYRLDREGRWSHKHGDEPATNKDGAGAAILDPRTADRGEYPEFLGFWWFNH